MLSGMYLPSEVSLAVIEGHYGWRAKKNRWCFTVLVLSKADRSAPDVSVRCRTGVSRKRSERLPNV